MSNSTNTIKDKVSIVGIGESAYYKRGQSPYPELELAFGMRTHPMAHPL